MEPIKIHANPVLSYLLIPLGGTLLVLSALTGPDISMLTGGICTLVGILYLINPLAVVTNDEIQMRNPLGMTLKRHNFRKDGLDIQGDKVLVNGKKITLTGWSFKKTDSDQAMTFLRGVLGESGEAYNHLIDG